MSPLFITPNDTARRIGVSRSTLDRMDGKAGFPARVQVGARRWGYVEAEVEAWMAARMNDREEPSE